MEKKNIINDIPVEKFELVGDKRVLHDVKLDTKPTTFLKDSFKRFCKNKSSVVAAVILGILILFSIFVPLFSTRSTDTVSTGEQFLEPKLFEAGTGFWDGTVKYVKKTNLDGSPSGVMYDRVNETPAGFYKPAVMNLVVDTEPTLINQASDYATGGYIILENQRMDGTSTVALSSDTLSVTKDGNYSVAFAFGNQENALGGQLGEYRISFATNETSFELLPWTSSYSDVNFNLSKLVPVDEDSLVGRVIIELKSVAGKYSYVLIKNCIFAAEETVDNYDELSKLGFTNPSVMALTRIDSQGNAPRGYWSCTGRKGVFAVEVYYCSFVYDTYAAAYDEQEVTYASTEVQAMIDKGWCTYDASIGPSSFVKLSDECPIESVTEQKLNAITGRLLELKAMSYRFKKMGYSKMPKFIFGTDASGIDVFTRMFKGLLTSLGLGVATFAFCFLFGLVWGSISGYFGGAVDLAMERFCDILGGVPWIVIMTLCILHLGNNFTTFVLALCLTGWMGTAGGTRTQFYRFKHMEYVLASRTLGSGHLRLIFKHILPNSLGTIVTSSVLMIPSVIFSESTLAYLNLGLQGVPSFGVMLSDNQQYIQSHPYLIVIPSIVMALLMISFNLFGNGLRDAINPTLKGA